MMEIELGKKYETRDGKWIAKILEVDKDADKGTEVVTRLTNKSGGNKLVELYHLDGSYSLEETNGDVDLVEAKEKKNIEFWLAICSDGMIFDLSVKPTKTIVKNIEESYGTTILAIKHVSDDYYEGEGLPDA